MAQCAITRIIRKNFNRKLRQYAEIQAYIRFRIAYVALQQMMRYDSSILHPNYEATIMTDFNTQALAMSKSLADTTFKAHSLALESLERMTALHFKAIESRFTATANFFSEASEARDFEDLKTMWPKGVSLVKESAEKLYANSQEVFGITVKTGEAMSQLAKGSFEHATDNLKKSVSAATSEFTSKVNAAAKKTSK